MRTYIRSHQAGAWYFFTVNLAERHGNDLLVRNITNLRAVFRQVRSDHPFEIDAMVVLPDHLHCLWRLPPGDNDYPKRWRLIKAGFSRGIEDGERISRSRRRKGERRIWQRRYWEHVIRDEEDYRRHMDYIHYNPVKHGYVHAVREWPYSSFHRWVRVGVYSIDWAATPEIGEWHWE
jgi:putative transposase